MPMDSASTSGTRAGRALIGRGASTASGRDYGSEGYMLVVVPGLVVMALRFPYKLGVPALHVDACQMHGCSTIKNMQW